MTENLLNKYLPTYKKKNFGLLAGTLLISLLLYQLSIRKTLALRNNFLHQQAELARASTANEIMNQYQSALAEMTADAVQPYDREILLETITSYCRANALLIESFPRSTSSQQDNFSVQTNKLEVTGAYHDLVGLLYLLEYEKKLSMIGSVRFYTKKERKTKQQKLYMQCILQNLEEQS